MSRLPPLAGVGRRITPASVTLYLFVGYACWGAYGVYREHNRIHGSVPVADHLSTPGPGYVGPALTDVQRDFVAEKFREGDPVEWLLTAHPTTLVIRHPPYMTVYYRGRSNERDLVGEVKVIAKNGKLFQATTYIATGPRECSEIYYFGNGGLMFSTEYMETVRAALRHREGALMAVAGAAGVVAFRDDQPPE